jgi:sugar lactone lactonase YvrE
MTLEATIYATTDAPLGNGAFTADGRLVVSHHPMYQTPHRVSVFRSDGGLDPFPNLKWNTPEGDPAGWLDAVLGLHDDSKGRIWLADMGTRSKVPAKFVVWDTEADALWRVIPIPPEVLTPYSEPNDFVVDEARGQIYVADEGAGGGGDGSLAALIVLDIETGAARRRLQGFDGIRAEPQPLMIGGRPVEHNNPDGSRTPLHVGVDGIVMDAAGEWLYLSPLNGRSLWRVQVEDLLDPALDDPALAKRLERYAEKPNSGGMCMTANGDIYMTEIEANAVARVSGKDRSLDRPVVRPDMFWPDGIMAGPDGALYVVVTQLPRSPALARPGDTPELPFKVFRFDPKDTTR